MRPSPLRHPLAVLRQTIGISQKELAELVGKSISAIQAIELKKLDLSKELALTISLETGCSLRWLLDGDPSVPPSVDDAQPVFSEEDRKFSKATFERQRAYRAAGKSGPSERFFFFGHAGAKLTAIELAARDHPDRNLASYRIWKFLGGLEKEFGISRDCFDEEMKKIELWRELGILFRDPDSDYDIVDSDTAEEGAPTWSFYKEFVPALIKTYEKLAKVFDARLKRHNRQEPGLFPLLLWVTKAMRAISLSRPHPLLLKKAAGSSKSPV
jgi:transcriptional regulator with XRE-family HTH domain